jgi:hypothetical protein
MWSETSVLWKVQPKLRAVRPRPAHGTSGDARGTPATETDMNAEERSHIEQECRDLVNRLVHYSDHLRKKEASELFATDGTWVRSGKAYVGRAAITESFTISPTEYVRHLATGTLIDVDDNSHARGVTYYIVYRHDPGTAEPKLPMPLGMPFSMGEWHDRFVRTDEGWRFAHREVQRLFQA